MGFKLKSGNKLPSFKMMGSSSPLTHRIKEEHEHVNGEVWFEPTETVIQNPDGTTTTKYHQEGSKDTSESDADRDYQIRLKKHPSGGSYDKVWEKMSDEDKEEAGGFAKWYREAKAWNEEQLRLAKEAKTGDKGEDKSEPLVKDWEETTTLNTEDTEDPEDPGGSGGGGSSDGGRNKKNRGKIDWGKIGDFFRGDECGGDSGRPCWDQ